MSLTVAQWASMAGIDLSDANFTSVNHKLVVDQDCGYGTGTGSCSASGRWATDANGSAQESHPLVRIYG